MKELKELIQSLQGKKTYTVGAVVCLLVFGSWQGWWKVPDGAYRVLEALGLIFLRHGVKKEVGDLLDSAIEIPDPAKPQDGGKAATTNEH